MYTTMEVRLISGYVFTTEHNYRVDYICTAKIFTTEHKYRCENNHSHHNSGVEIE